jgi:hypothetical protein
MLDREVACFQRHLPRLRVAGKGQYVLILGDRVLGVFPTETAAVRAGFDQCGLAPFFVSRIRRKAEHLSVPRTVVRS